MAGRGRGRATSSFTQEQLQMMGCAGKDLQTIDRTLAPPPLFPMLATKPVALDNSSERQYKVLWKEDFIGYLRDSPYFTKTKTPEQKVQRYSDAYIDVLEDTSKSRQKGEFLWDTMPAELRPSAKRLRKREGQRVVVKTEGKKVKAVDIVAKLNQLERQEQTEERTKMTKIKEEPESENEEEQEDPEMEDEEMDDENDYGNNYFDNGEAFNEEDDNLDDGPIY
ncbi:DNA-directed RNA polymerase III subunit RPC7-like [Phlebotomus argentipes]|uniref:DNA-directed RNA polymerase III subunit RPC7-like n=1 Tax=Phlebotomus argentipes TaxID=94469 RepID=UPI00289301B6|nr:DNA-directed RNA polymerase III subunit RPC7-like [Phlebotomus argentipes]